MNNLKRIAFSGIDRTSGRFATPGAMEEAINVAKRRSNQYEVIGRKEVQATYPVNLELYDYLYRYPALPDNELLGVLNDSLTLYRITTSDVTEIFDFNAYEEVVNITHLGNIVTLHTTRDAYFLKYDPSTDEFTELDFLPVPQLYMMPDPDRTIEYDTEEQSSFEDALADFLERDAISFKVCFLISALCPLPSNDHQLKQITNNK